jgi:hypothetical protein
MKYNKLILAIILVLVLAACAPSPQAIQTSVSTSIPDATFTPPPISIPTPTHTLVPPTQVFPKTTYILESGWCLLAAGDFGNVDPKTITNRPGGINICQLLTRQQIELYQGDGVGVHPETPNNKIEIWCALFSLDGTFIMSDVDAVGSGEAKCFP